MNKLLKITAVVMMLLITLTIVYAFIIRPKIQEKKLDTCIEWAELSAREMSKSIIKNYDGSTAPPIHLLEKNDKDLKETKQDCYRRFPIK